MTTAAALSRSEPESAPSGTDAQLAEHYARYQQNPEDLAAVRRIAQLYEREGADDDALNWYRIAVGLAGSDDPDLLRKVDELNRKRRDLPGAAPELPPPATREDAAPVLAPPAADGDRPPLIRASGLRQSFRIGTHTLDVLRGVTLDVAAGEAVFLVGASGAGKTTLLYTLAGLERPAGGTVVFEGHSLYELGRRAQARLRNERMGFIFQGYFLLPELTAFENVLLPAMIGGHTRTGAERAANLLREVGLADRMHHLPLELSGGEQQRVAIARALINEPSIVFADEPTGNLDSRAGAAIMDLLLALVREKRKTLLVVTHDLRLADLGDRKLEMRDGLLETHHRQPPEPFSRP